MITYDKFDRKTEENENDIKGLLIMLLFFFHEWKTANVANKVWVFFFHSQLTNAKH